MKSILPLSLIVALSISPAYATDLGEVAQQLQKQVSQGVQTHLTQLAEQTQSRLELQMDELLEQILDAAQNEDKQEQK